MIEHLTKAARIFVTGCLASVGYLIDEALEALDEDDDDDFEPGHVTVAPGAEEFLGELRRDYHGPDDIAASQACEADDCYWCWINDCTLGDVVPEDADEDAEPQ